MKTTLKFTIGDASTESAFITNADGYDVAVLTRYTPDSEPSLLPGHYLDGDQWQNLIDTIDAARHMGEIVTAARALLPLAEMSGVEGDHPALVAFRAALAKLDPQPAGPKSYAYPVKLAEKISLGLSNRDGEIMIGKGVDGRCYLITEADTYHNEEVFEGLGSTEHIEITAQAFLSLANDDEQQPRLSGLGQREERTRHLIEP